MTYSSIGSLNSQKAPVRCRQGNFFPQHVLLTSYLLSGQTGKHIVKQNAYYLFIFVCFLEDINIASATTVTFACKRRAETYHSKGNNVHVSRNRTP